MSGIFPIREKVTLDEDRGPRLVDIDDDVADDVFEALSSRTTRHIFRELHDSPQTASDLATATDTSVQNVQYHLEKLIETDLVDVADTWYSERGTEMKVYAPTDESLVLFAGRDTEGTLRTLLTRIVGGLGVLAPASLFVWWLTDHLVGEPGRPPAAGGGDGGVSIAADSVEAASGGSGVDPAVAAGVAFFLGGVFLIAATAVYLSWRR